MSGDEIVAQGDAIDPGRLEDRAAAWAIIDTLREERLAQGLTQSQLAKRAHTSQGDISDMERHAVEPRIITVQRYARAMGRHFGIRLVDPDAPPVPAYVDRRMHYPRDISVVVRAEPVRGLASEAPLTAGPTVALGNLVSVTFVQIEDHPLSASLARRLLEVH